MQKLKISTSQVSSFIDNEKFKHLQKEVEKHHLLIEKKEGKGSDFLGWHHLPSSITPEFINDIKETANRIKAKAKYFVVIGIGGSYLGARAVIEALNSPFSAFQENDNPKIIYAGQNLSEDYLFDLLQLLDNNDYALTVISKSGTTTEPAVAFRLLKQHLENKYGEEEAASRIIAITDAEKGALRTLATQKGYKTYVVPDDVGGRYSVLTPVGLLPIAVAGYSIDALVNGSKFMERECLKSTNLKENPAALYAITRNALLNEGFDIEMLINYSPTLMYFTEWWKQLYGESEGKENKGIFPAGASFTTDLHSMGQYIQEGRRVIFETLISVKSSKNIVLIPDDNQDLDGLNYLKGKNVEYINQMAQLGTSIAHVDGGVPNIKLEIDAINEENIGQLIYFFELACAYSGYLLEVNPFNQPGVEAYKKNMFALLAKPGFEKETEEIRKRL
ncbi:MAG: glucose-6-phosphate isomerase [Bacteroidetes bacterium]|nr:MAG: glucose-6-phosphate isomerase [Bacteroidota bacterium]